MKMAGYGSTLYTRICTGKKMSREGEDEKGKEANFGLRVKN